MKVFMGVDAGGTKTHVLIVDENGRVMGQGIVLGNANHQNNRDEAERNIRSACERALMDAGVAKDDITFAFFGLAGADREPDYAVLNPMIAALEFKRYKIVCDTMIGMRAGTTQSQGVVIISGTGSNCAARNAKGEELDYGGFGYMFGDGHGSGTDLAVHAFRSVVRAWERRGEPTLLTELVLKHTGVDTVAELYEAILYGRMTLPMSLSKLIFEAADLGDQVAIRILDEEGAEFGNSARALIERLNMQDDEFDVVLAGSVLSKSKSLHMINGITRVINQVAPKAKVVRVEMDPVVGAVMSAMDCAGHTIDAATYEALRNIKFL